MFELGFDTFQNIATLKIHLAFLVLKISTTFLTRQGISKSISKCFFCYRFFSPEKKHRSRRKEKNIAGRIRHWTRSELWERRKGCFTDLSVLCSWWSQFFWITPRERNNWERMRKFSIFRMLKNHFKSWLQFVALRRFLIVLAAKSIKTSSFTLQNSSSFLLTQLTLSLAHFPCCALCV